MFMLLVTRVVLTLVSAGSLLSADAATASRRDAAHAESTGMHAAHTLSTITDVAMSPLLGVGAVGTHQWWTTS